MTRPITLYFILCLAGAAIAFMWPYAYRQARTDLIEWGHREYVAAHGGIPALLVDDLPALPTTK